MKQEDTSQRSASAKPVQTPSTSKAEPRSHKKENQKKQLLLSVLWPLPALLAFAGQRLLAAYPDFTEQWHAQRLFRLLSVPISWLTSKVPVSLTELLALFGIPLLLVLLAVFIVRTVRSPGHRLRRFGRLVRSLAWTVSVLYLVFMLLHGFNYARLPVAASFDLPVTERSSEELAEAAEWMIRQINSQRPSLLEDEAGVFIAREPIRRKLKTSDAGYHIAAADYPLLAGHPVRAKAVFVSRYWSYTGITGMYFPFLVEANVNIDPPHFQVLFTAMHEIAHLRGFAREDEADFMAFLTGLYHPDPDYRYAALLSTANRCLNALYRSDREMHTELLGRINEASRRDLQAARAYWRQFEGPVREASTSANHAFLQANLQEDGVRSYGRMVDLALGWYENTRDNGHLELFETR